MLLKSGVQVQGQAPWPHCQELVFLPMSVDIHVRLCPNPFSLHRHRQIGLGSSLITSGPLVYLSKGQMQSLVGVLRLGFEHTGFEGAEVLGRVSGELLR